MGEKVYGNVLTVILVIVILGIIGLLVFFGIDLFQKISIEKDTGEVIKQYDDQIPDVNNNVIKNETIEVTLNDDEQNIVIDFPSLNALVPSTNTSTSSTSSSSSKIKYKGFNMVGKITIARTGLECPVLEDASKPAMEVAVGVQYGPGLNKIGNTIIAGHNYRNGLFFSNNKNIQLGDKIKIKDNSGVTVTYTVYSKFETTDEDTSYVNRDTGGKREITLYTCNDDASKRLIILARE